MIAGTLSRRYAKALFGLAQDSGRADAWAGQLEKVRGAITGSAELAEVLLEGREASRAERASILQALAGRLGLDESPARLLALLAERDRLALLVSVIEAFTAMADEAANRVAARVTSAVPVAPDALERLAAKLSRASGSEVRVEAEVDPALLGGVVAQVGRLTYDGSVVTQLDMLRETMKQ